MDDKQLTLYFDSVNILIHIDEDDDSFNWSVAETDHTVFGPVVKNMVADGETRTLDEACIHVLKVLSEWTTEGLTH